MSRGPWKTKPSFLSNAIKGFKRGTKCSDDDICVLVDLKDGAALICAKAPCDPVMHSRDASPGAGGPLDPLGHVPR